MLTQTIALELAQYNIRLNAIAPGVVPYKEDAIPEIIESLLQRVGAPMNQAAAALYLASKESSWITSQIMIIDGDRTLSLH